MNTNLNLKAIYGAITDLSSEDAEKHAKLYYEEIRHMTTDVQKISENTGFSFEQILHIKQFLFLEKHKLGDSEEPRLFDECFEIAQSWQRLLSGKEYILPHDIMLLNHELLEMEYICKGLSQEEAHMLTNKRFNYTEASDAYYQNLQVSVPNKTIIGGAIKRNLSYKTH